MTRSSHNVNLLPNVEEYKTYSFVWLLNFDDFSTVVGQYLGAIRTLALNFSVSSRIDNTRLHDEGRGLRVFGGDLQQEHESGLGP